MASILSRPQCVNDMPDDSHTEIELMWPPFVFEQLNWVTFITLYMHATGNQLSIDKNEYRQTSNISHSLVGNGIVNHSDVVGPWPVGSTQTTSSFSTWHLSPFSISLLKLSQFETKSRSQPCNLLQTGFLSCVQVSDVDQMLIWDSS